MTTYFAFDKYLLTKTQIGLPLKSNFTAFYRAYWLDFLGHVGQDRTYTNFELRFYFPGFKKWFDLLIKDCIYCQSNKDSQLDKKLLLF